MFELVGARLIHSQLHSVWRPVAGLCEVPNSDITKLNVLATLATDVILLLMVLAGLLRLRLGGGGMFDLGSFLLKQGIISLSLVVFAGILPAVFLILNINEQFNLMFQVPSLISVTISATRVYRSLIHFSSDTSGLPLSRISFAKVKVDSNVSRVIPLSPMDVVVHTTRHDDSFPRKTDSRSLDEQLGVEEHKLWSDEDVTSSKEKVISIREWRWLDRPWTGSSEEFVKCTYLLETSEKSLIFLITLVSEVVSDEGWFEYNIAIPRLTVSADSFSFRVSRADAYVSTEQSFLVKTNGPLQGTPSDRRPCGLALPTIYRRPPRNPPPIDRDISPPFS
ncbi:hypothetical protein BGW80DRAFT_1565522 [Lactifluus volemus]|nr:hypothetical protein BGW80DRAFT_1565522 [Lactifluus volemus]